MDDSTADGTQTVTVSASASGYIGSSDSLEVTDDEASFIAVLDNNESGFTHSGFRYQNNGQVSAAYGGDNHNMQGGSGSANWTFDNLEDGEYQVAATWAHKYNNKYNTLDAPYSVANASGTVLASATVDQSNAPSEFTYDGYGWDTIGTVNVTGGSIVVTLGAGSASSKYTIADAIRIEKLSGNDSSSAFDPQLDSTTHVLEITGNSVVPSDEVVADIVFSDLD